MQNNLNIDIIINHRKKKDKNIFVIIPSIDLSFEFGQMILQSYTSFDYDIKTA